MHFKLIIVMVKDEMTGKILEAARDNGATGCTVINQARGEGLMPAKTFLGLSIDNHVDVILLLVEEHMSREILETISTAGKFVTCRPCRRFKVAINPNISTKQ